MDVVTVSGNGIAVWFGTATGFAASRTLPAISAGEPTITPANVQFGDLNGDGLADALAVNSSGMIEFRGKGDGTFERIGPVSYPWTGTTDTTQVRLADLDRDGLLDIVRIGTSQVFWYRGKPDGTFNVQARVLDRPAGADASTVVQLADANGNGSTDVVWSSPSGMWALDLAGPTNAGLLVGIDNGLGKTQRFVYTASTQLAWAAEAAATPWSTRMPVSIAVTTTATQVLASGEPDRTSLLDVRDGIYEADERRFIGFAQSIQTLPGSAAADTIRIVTTYHPGHGGDRVLRGQPLSIRTEDGTGRVFRQVDNQCSALPVVGLPDDPRLKRAAVTQTQITTSEPGETPAVVRTRFAFDPEVRAYETRRDGRIVDGVALDGDESITRRTFTSEDPTTGVRDLVCEEDLLDGAETVVSQVQRRFGDATSVADPCHPGRGWVREELGYLAEQTRWVSTRQTAYDVDGNPTLIIADGVARTLGYDSHGLHPTSETVSPADGQTLVWTAQWDDVRGTLTRVDSAAGTSARMTYDGLGRLLSIAAGDALPHAFYRYQWESPRPRTETFTFDGEPSALGALPDVWTPTAGWRHAVTISNSAGEQLVAAVQLDTNQWNVSELRARDHRGRVTAVTSAFAFAGSDPGVATAPGDAATQTLVYDPLDRVTDQKLATGAHKRSTYHPLGVTIAIDGLATLDTRVDGQDRTTHTERTVDGVVESVDATYDAAGRIRQFRLQGDQVHHDFTYDSLGRMTGAVDPDVGSRSLGYDDAGRVVRAENGAGDVTTYAYDGAGRVISVDGPGIANRFHYDVARSAGFDHTGSQLAWVEDAAGSVDLGYDTYGHLMTHQRTVAGTSPALVGRETTVFSPSGLPRTVDLGDGVVLPLQYDAAGRVTQIADAWSVASYDAGDQPVREQYGNGVVQRYDRDLLHRPTRVTIENATGALYRVAASYHAFGPISTLTDDDHVGIDHTASFGFDGAGRLISAAMGTGTAAYHFNYGYDGLQNMTKREATGPSELGILSGSYQYRTDAPRQLDHIVAASGATIAGFAYDGAGRQVQHADKQLTYDALSKLVRVDGVAGGSIEHRYGYDGGRVWTRSAAGAMTYWITPNVVVRGNERDHYVRAGERVVAKITTTSSAAVAVGAAGMTGTRPGLAGLLVLWILAIAGMMWRQRGQRKLRAVGAATVVPLLAMISCASPFASQTSALAASPRLYYHQTYGAGPELTTDSAGQLVEDRRSEPFGAAIDAFRGGAVQAIDYQANPLNALNKFTDPDTRWSYHGARWLAPDTAQWHTPDPPATAPDPKFMQSPWGLNPYQYVNQNPVAYWDPDGKCSAPIIGPGQVGICIEAYIAADKIGIFDLGRGDNRGTEAYNPLETNRIQQQITFDLQNHTVASQTQIAMSEVVIPDLGFEMGGGGGPTSIVLQGTGETNVRDVWRNFAGGTDFKAGGHGVNGFSSMPGGPSGSIDYSFTFRVDDDGTVSLVGGGHKGYPSYSVYSYKADEDGNVTATPLLESKENKIEDLDNPFYGPQNNQPEYGPIQTYYDGGGGGGGGDE
jgi:RHS repeat-associated protein